MGEVRRILSDLAKARIPRRFWQASFDGYRPATASQAAALHAVQAWLRTLDQGPMLALVGAQGTGKSHLLYSAAHELIEHRKPCWVRQWYTFVDELRYGRTIATEAGSRTKEPYEVRADWWEAPVVLLDEVRATSGTNFDDTELARYACHAYDQQRAVLITTNVHPLEDVLGPAAASRFTVIVVDGPDARHEKVA